MLVKDLFCHNRFPDGGALLLLMFYIPCGLLLVIVRFFFGLQLLLVMSILPKESLIKRILFRVSSAILGIAVTQEGSENYSKGQHKVFISNHVTALDNVAIETVLPSIMPFSKCDCPWLIKWILGYLDFDSEKERENMDNKIKEYLQGSSLPLLVFPEEQITNGKRGLMKFNPWGFQFSDTVLPVLISVKRPLIVQLPAHVLESGWWQDFFWSMFVPYTHYHIRVLPPKESKSDDVCSDIQKVENQKVANRPYSSLDNKQMASALGVVATSYSSEDVSELIKQISLQAAQAKTQSQQPKPDQNGRTPPNQGPNNASPNTRLTRMVQQVKEVLPQVPSAAIARDLSRTHCVDTTITNILEGRVSYVPENENNKAESSRDVKSTPTRLSNETTPTKPQTITFSRSSEERQKLLNQRKAMMLENARRRFTSTET